jgi:hypothetical protein
MGGDDMTAERPAQPDAEPPGHHPDPDPGELEPGSAEPPQDPQEPPGHHPDPDPAELDDA